MSARATLPSFVLTIIAPPVTLAGSALLLRLGLLPDDMAALLLFLSVMPGLAGVWLLPIRPLLRTVLMPIYALAATAILFVGGMAVACRYQPCY